MTPGRYPSLAIRITIAGRTFEAAALIDIGLDGHLAVPLAASLPRPTTELLAEAVTRGLCGLRCFEERSKSSTYRAPSAAM